VKRRNLRKSGIKRGEDTGRIGVEGTYE